MDLYDDLFVSRKIPRDIVFREKEEFQNDGVFAEEEETNNEYGENVEGNEYPEELVKDIVEKYDIFEEIPLEEQKKEEDTIDIDYEYANEEEEENKDIEYLLEGVENIEE